MPQLIEKTAKDQVVSMLSHNEYAIVYQCAAFDIAQTRSIIRQATSLSGDSLAIIDFHHGSPEHYTFIGLEAFASVKAQNDDSTNDPFMKLRRIRETIKPEIHHKGTRLTGSPVGYLGYHAIRYIEGLQTQHQNTLNVPDVNLHCFGCGIYLDYQKAELTISRIIQSEAEYQPAMQDIDNIVNKLFQKASHNTVTCTQSLDSCNTDINDNDFCDLVKQAKQYICEGEVFQMVLSRTFSSEFEPHPFSLYEKITENKLSPYHFYIQEPNYSIVGASPEKIIEIKNNKMLSTPLAGTRPYTDDKRQKTHELLNNEKELAEHMMLVDLARNDVGKVAKSGSVSVDRMTYPLILKNLIHIASDVTGELDTERFDIIDALLASFPAGTLSGAPKIRAMQLIDKLENSHRGVYGGCILAIDHQDNLDSCIIIRNAIVKEKKAFVRAGCGVVYDSDPLAETEETRHKAASMLDAISACQTGDHYDHHY